MSPVCGVCGQGGYWVALAPEGWRCANHIEVPRGACLVCGTECTTPEHDAQEPDGS